MCLCVHKCRGQCSVFLYCSSFYCLEIQSLAGPKAHCLSWVGWAVNSLCGKSVSQSSSSGVPGTQSYAQLFTCVLGFQTQVLLFVEQDFLPTKPFLHFLYAFSRLQLSPYIFLRGEPHSQHVGEARRRSEDPLTIPVRKQQRLASNPASPGF